LQFRKAHGFATAILFNVGSVRRRVFMIREMFTSKTLVRIVLPYIELLEAHLAFDAHQNSLASIDIKIVGCETSIARNSVQPPDWRFRNLINYIVVSDMH